MIKEDNFEDKLSNTIDFIVYYTMKSMAILKNWRHTLFNSPILSAVNRYHLIDPYSKINKTNERCSALIEYEKRISVEILLLKPSIFLALLQIEFMYNRGHKLLQNIKPELTMKLLTDWTITPLII